MNKERLLILADHLENGVLGHEKFDIKNWNIRKISENGCGTAGCAIDECPIVFPEFWEFRLELAYNLPKLKGEKLGIIMSGEKFFEINEEEFDHLFMGYTYDISNPTRYDVASRIKKFVENGL